MTAATAHSRPSPQHRGFPHPHTNNHSHSAQSRSRPESFSNNSNINNNNSSARAATPPTRLPLTNARGVNGSPGGNMSSTRTATVVAAASSSTANTGAAGRHYDGEEGEEEYMNRNGVNGVNGRTNSQMTFINAVPNGIGEFRVSGVQQQQREIGIPSQTSNPRSRPATAGNSRTASIRSTASRGYNNTEQSRDGSREDSEVDGPATTTLARRPRNVAGAPPLLRSRSDVGPRGEESDDNHTADEGQDWGARHGFEDHYLSEEYVSQLANRRSSGVTMGDFGPPSPPEGFIGDDDTFATGLPEYLLPQSFDSASEIWDPGPYRDPEPEPIYNGLLDCIEMVEKHHPDILYVAKPYRARLDIDRVHYDMLQLHPSWHWKPPISQDPSSSSGVGEVRRRSITATHREPETESWFFRDDTTVADRGGFFWDYNIDENMQNWYMYYTDKRHETTGNPKPADHELHDWRMKDRLKTVSAALAVCLNIGVEPPDQLKTNPGAKLEAWQDPTVAPAAKALESIGKALQAQYETLAIRTRYKQYLDPSVEETKKFCVSLRRNAKEERVLLHYNGHGVPKPTSSGEIWVFNKNYTQYIPVSLYDLQQWLQAPTFYVWDCSDAGNILQNFTRFVEKHEEEERQAALQDPNFQVQSYRPYIHLAACAAKENLPTNPALPADIFSCCLTTPIEMALWFFCLQTTLPTQITPERAKKMPGRLQERRTPLGELNWIFTAITDTIAWTSLPRKLFRQFFRQDLMVAALFRNFLLSQRIMAVYGCHPQSDPKLPDTRQHPLWASWDLAVDTALSQLPALEAKERGDYPDYEYQNSTFFTEQLTAFEVYLSQGTDSQKAPDQLPVVLQVLLSQQHRIRALILLGKFLDMGPWAVDLALSIGIFPYVLKLLQSAAAELKPVMVFIWTRVLAVDLSCQSDLLKDQGYQYFYQILRPTEGLPVVDNQEHKAMCAFILAMLCKDYRQGQTVCHGTEIMPFCLTHLQHADNPLLRQWACLCISQMWNDYPEAKWRGIRENAHQKLCNLVRDSVCEVRAAMLYAMTTFLGIPDLTDEVEKTEEQITWTLIEMANDGNAMVRKEFLVYLSKYVKRYEYKFFVAAYEHLLEEKEYLQSPPKEDGSEARLGLHYAGPSHRNNDGTINTSHHGFSHNSIFAAVWKHILILSVDPHPEVQKHATIIVDCVHADLLQSQLGGPAQALMEEITRISKRRAAAAAQNPDQRPTTLASPNTSTPNSAPPVGLLRRTASYLMMPFGGGVTSIESSPTAPPRSPVSQRPIGMRNRLPVQDRPAPPEQNDGAATPGTYHAAREPVSGGYEPLRGQKQQQSLPLKSDFLEWSIEYFREPQMKPSEADEPGSTDYNERLWRRSRNENILRVTQPQKEVARSGKWANPCGFFDNKSQPTKMTMHQFEDHLAISDDRDTVCIWDWKKGGRLSRFSNGNPVGTKISDLKFINEDDQAFLMTGSSDGVIRIYRNYDSDQKVELASAWRALTHLVPSNVNSGMVFDWQQVSGKLLVAGDVKVIKVWSAAQEYCIMDIPARSGSCVTSLTSDQMTGNIFVAGFGDGAVRVFDARLRPQEAMVKKWKDDADRDWVRDVHMQRGGQRELLSASRNGRVKLWDIRMDKAIRVIQTTRDVLRTASTHEHLPVFAVGTAHHKVKVFNFAGTELSSFEPYSFFLKQKNGSPISATAFHPHRMMLAAAGRGDNHVNLFECAESTAGSTGGEN